MAKQNQTEKNESAKNQQETTTEKVGKEKSTFADLGWEKQGSFYIINRGDVAYRLKDGDKMSIDKVDTKKATDQTIYHDKSMNKSELEKFMKENGI